MTRRTEHRSLAAADPYLALTGAAQWTDFTIARSTREGYKVSGWVFKAVSLIARTAASVPWGLYTEDGELFEEHSISRALMHPNPQMSRQDLFELLVAWLQLAGVGYLYRIGNTEPGARLELWPISPDRLAPVASREPGKLLAGYHAINEKGERESRLSTDYTPETIIHFKLLDPSNPIQGISPLAAAARSVDIDNAMAEWNKAGMDNRGVFDGVFSFDQQLSEDQARSITERIKERFFGRERARRPLVLGSNAKYQRLSITPAEMDFIASRKWNREEIMSIFGVPPQLVGSQEASTYNNFSESLRIFWASTVIPLLDDIASTFEQAFGAAIPTGAYIGYDLSQVTALQKTESERVDTVRKYWDMGVPLAVLNEHLGLGLPEFLDWDKPFTGRSTAPALAQNDQSRQAPRGPRFELRAHRDLEAEHRSRDQLAEGPIKKTFAGILDGQRKALFALLDTGERLAVHVTEALALDEKAALEALAEQALEVAVGAADTVSVGNAGRSLRAEPEFIEEIRAYLEQEGWMLRDLSLMQATTVALVLEQIEDALANGSTTQELKQAIDDVGAFGPSRSLMLSRTLAGTAASVGQIAGARAAGATWKEWTTAGFGVRDIHTTRDGERVQIDQTYSDQGYGAPRYPLDPNLGPADRCNCRCAQKFYYG